MTYLNRQGFNPTAVRPAAKAFLGTMVYLQELGAIESHGLALESESGSGGSADDGTTYGGAQVGDLVQWESQGAFQFETPRRVRFVTDDGLWVAVEGSETGVPMEQVIVEERGDAGNPRPPHIPLVQGGSDHAADAGGTDLRFKLGKGKVVRVSSPEELGASELEKLLKLLEAQKDALDDD